MKEQLKNKANIKSDKAVDATHKESWNWAISQEIIKGDGKSMNPSGVLTRQQMATMLKRYYEYIVK
ncbi:S-layer homology domain-containing protein [Lysinibacillus sphaericus]|uniref:Teichoic acid-binding N-acetylmuramoyl L-alalanine amidase n=1 Tax=Lysinibacillus sphaericus OT4b.31 TaxID=1285586 RepID=R7ZDQ3_LYSSH|nr:S-layer homology domain-containing protein [Lysinibacillus sphaericus]EON72267.1 teichoic acid-binding N-acetylmuramoyl L-alalanine amidase [Lysinibacillus sphaericus OT4b.31]